MKKIINNSNIELLVWFITGFFGLSALSNSILTLLNMPYIFEVFFVPVMLYYSNFKLTIKTKISVKFFFLLVFICISTIFGIIETNDIWNIITCVRPFVYLCVIAYAISHKEKSISISMVYALSFGVLVGELINKVIFIGNLSTIDHINTFALIMFVIIPFIIKNEKQIVFSSIFGFFMAFTTLYRRELVTYIISLFCGIFHFYKHSNYKKKFFSLLLVMLIGILLYLNINDILTYIIDLFHLDDTANYSLSATYRLIEKMKSINNASDSTRIGIWKQAVDNFYDRLVPRGPVGKSFGLDYFGLYTDSTNVYMYDVFGSVLSILLYLYILIIMLRNAISYIKNEIFDESRMLSSLVIIPFIFCLLCDGTFLVHANIAVLAGIAIQGWFRNKK